MRLSKNQIVTVKKVKEYACPMQCKGEKVYLKPGTARVCNMHYVPVEKSGKLNSDQCWETVMSS